MIDCDTPIKNDSYLPETTRNVREHFDKVVDNLLSSILSNTKSSVHIRNLATTREKIVKVISKGSSSLQVVSDFDQTMSKYKHNGILSPSCHGIFEMDPELTVETKKKLIEIREKYHPIELDHKLSDKEKIPYMIEWWDLTHRTIVECGIHRDALAKTVTESGLMLRNGVREFTNLLHKNAVPLLIFSAGLGDVIQLLLKHFSMLTRNVRIVSNFMKFDEKGLLVGFSDPILHTFNKTAASIANGDYETVTHQRPCVLLLGDSTGDVHMADGATVDDPLGESGTVLRIGFLNNSVEAYLDKYKQLYDIVLVDDDTFDVPLAILHNILQCHGVLANNKAH